jgi:Immunity protein 8
LTENNVREYSSKYIVIDKYEWDSVKNKIEEIINGQFGINWDDLAGKINKFFAWEFDGYGERRPMG